MHKATPATQLGWYETLCDSLQDSVLLLRADGGLWHANQRFCEATGRSIEELVGRHYTALEAFVAADSWPEFRECVEAVLSGTATERRVELEGHSPREGDRIVEARITRFDSPDFEGAAVVVRDLTDILETTERLSLKSEQLAVVNSVLRHDIRNHMNVMLGWADQLEAHARAGEAEEMLDRIQRHGTHIVELTHAARELVDAIEEGWEMTIRPMDVEATVRQEVELVREEFPGAEILVCEPVPSVAVQANEFLGSVLSNLLTNAVRHNDAETPRVWVSVDVTADTVRIDVADNGPGIPDAQKDAVFDMGVAGPDSPGTGLGLYLVQSVVRACGGSVALADNDPRGAVVTVELDRTA